MLDNILNPPAVVRRLNFSEEKATRRRKRKLINVTPTELVSYMCSSYTCMVYKKFLCV